MTTVNITETKNSVTVNEGTSTVVTVATQGPQGPSFSQTNSVLDDAAKVNNSVVFFDSTSGTFKADATRTVENLVDGGSF
ncbi:MAG: hypothetical protein Unbinned1007contig1000_19 [Prokaryotic dsDNA virus sp.]|nr:MAG: hypothetical protein Unbinned1007contig1000_19 [Prokaryotic dsDNA virus sp.]|tara:strand:+ start:16007 stop:16246 length:240 start_codon:yes stop_codon:yes gene_type:complete